MIQIINYILLGTYGLSTLITVVNNASSNSRIRRKGFDIKPITNNSILENIKYCIKDFGFLVVPGYNLFRSIWDTVKKDSEFDHQKMEKLTDRDRLVKVEKIKSDKNSSSNEKETKVERKEEPRKPSKVESKVENKKEEAKNKMKTIEEMTCYEKRDYYKNEYYRLLSLRNKCKQEGKSVSTLNEISHRMQLIVSEYNKSNRECELEELRTERDIILSSIENQRKLIRK